jgi:hypothetical protein
MKTENSKNWMVWAIFVLALMNLSTLGTIVYQRNKPSAREDSVIREKNISEDASVKFSGRYFRDELSLSKEQMNKFSEFNPAFRQAVRSINQQLILKRKEMLLEMAGENCDTNRLNTICDSIGYLHSSLKKQTCLYYLDFKKICDASQQQKLEQLFSEMFTADSQMVQYGNNGPNGKRSGRRFNN